MTDSAGRPVGRLPLAKLVFSPPDAKVQDIMEPDVHAVPTDMDREQVAEIVRRYDLLSVPVVDPQTGIVMGIVTVDDVLDAAADEAAEDMYRLAGTGATDPLHQPILKRDAAPALAPDYARAGVSRRPHHALARLRSGRNDGAPLVRPGDDRDGR